MKVLIACEESQAVCLEFRKLGHEAYSCDLKPCTGGYPQWHITGDAVVEAYSGKYDMMIAHPPCTDLAVSGAAWFKIKIADGRQAASIALFMAFVNAPIDKIVIENPIGIMSTKYKKPTQIIEPYYFGDPAKKPTCLWIKGLSPLVYSKSEYVAPELVTMTSKKTGRVRTYSKWEYEASCNQQERATIRSKTFKGIAVAMARQWGGVSSFSQTHYQLTLF